MVKKILYGVVALIILFLIGRELLENKSIAVVNNRLLLKQSITNPFQSLYLRVLNQG